MKLPTSSDIIRESLKFYLHYCKSMSMVPMSQMFDSSRWDIGRIEYSEGTGAFQIHANVEMDDPEKLSLLMDIFMYNGHVTNIMWEAYDEVWKRRTGDWKPRMDWVEYDSITGKTTTGYARKTPPRPKRVKQPKGYGDWS